MKHAHVRMSDSIADYFMLCARIRGIDRTALLQRLFKVIAEDQLVSSILDDDGKRKLNKSERKFKEGKENGFNS